MTAEKDRLLPSADGSELLWILVGDLSQRVAVDMRTGFRFVITHCTDPKSDGLTWEVEHVYPRGGIAVDYFPTLTAALSECDARVSARRGQPRDSAYS